MFGRVGKRIDNVHNVIRVGDTVVLVEDIVFENLKEFHL